MKSPSDLLYLDSNHTNNRFAEYQIDIDDGDILVTFNSFIPKLGISMVESRDDMFNISSHPLAKKWKLNYDHIKGFYYQKSSGINKKIEYSIPLDKSNYI